MIHDLTLRWVVTGLFALSAVECGLAVVIKRRPWTFVVSHGLHFVMAVAMVVMAWPSGAQLPPTGPAGFFLLAAGWFVAMGGVAARTAAPRLLYGYHGLMMLATAWMYVIMDDRLLPAGPSSALSMPAMGMGAMSMPSGGGAPVWFGAVNWMGTIGCALAAVFWTGKHFTEGQPDAAQSRSLRNLSQATMAAGMALLFVATLFPI
jgi:hypothetical protein